MCGPSFNIVCKDIGCPVRRTRFMGAAVRKAKILYVGDEGAAQKDFLDIFGTPRASIATLSL